MVNYDYWYALVSLKAEECKKCMYLSSMGMRERFTVALLMVLLLSVILIIREQRRISFCKSYFSYLILSIYSDYIGRLNRIIEMSPMSNFLQWWCLSDSNFENFTISIYGEFF